MSTAVRAMVAVGLTAAIVLGIHYGTPGPVARPAAVQAAKPEPVKVWAAKVAECARLWPGPPSHGYVECTDRAYREAVGL